MDLNLNTIYALVITSVAFTIAGLGLLGFVIYKVCKFFKELLTAKGKDRE